MIAPDSRSQPTPESVRQFDEADGHACSLRQQSTWVEESREAKVSVYERITLDDIDTDEMRAAAQFIENQAAEAASLKARAEQAERSVDVLEAALRKIQAKTEGERHTVNEQNVFKYWGLLNLMMIEIRDIARAALPQPRDVARAKQESGA